MPHRPEFADAWLRLERAKARPKQFDAIQQEWRTRNLDAYRHSVERDKDGNAALILHIKTRPPKEWGLALGDILQDLRSTLDYAVFALAVKHGPDPLPDPKSVEFPIAKPGGVLVAGAIKYLPKGAKDLIQSLQPKNASNGLFILDQLVNIHKHRFPPITWAVAQEVHINMTDRDVDITEFIPRHITGELKIRTELATWKETATGPKPYVKVEPDIRTAIAFSPTETTVDSYPVLRLIAQLITIVERCVLELESHV